MRIFSMIRGVLIAIAAWGALALAGAPRAEATAYVPRAALAADIGGASDLCPKAVACAAVACAPAAAPAPASIEAPLPRAVRRTACEISAVKPSWTSGRDPPVPRPGGSTTTSAINTSRR